jgi:ABC-2 type transport system ATP-binding protein
MAAVVVARDLTKHYRVGNKEPGAWNTLSHFFRRRYRTVEAVKGVSFSVDEGEVVGFLGPNGAGKTTALKMLTGLIHPTAGSVEVAGHVPFDRKKDFLRQITLVMGQKQQLLWDLPAADSLRINAAVYELEDSEFKRRTGELAEMLELGDRLSQPVRKLSLGERMKVELLASLLHRPRVLFLDEPTLGLDVNAQAAMREFLRDYNERYGASVLLTSHYMADIVALCRRVLVIHEGELGYDGPLSGLVDELAPYREIKVDLAEAISREEAERVGEVTSVEGRVVRFRVPREELAATVSRVLDAWSVEDLVVSDPPVEQIIAQVFKEGVRS